VSLACLPMVHVIGDVMLDVDIHGVVSRNSPEEPNIPIVRSKGWTYHLGGAANVAYLLAQQGADVMLFGAVGSDWAGDQVERLCYEHGMDPILCRDLPTTTTKIRAYTNSHYLSRTDVECPTPVTGLIPGSLEPADVVILSDYNKGVFSQKTIDATQALIGSLDCPIVADCKATNYLNAFRGATAITPNKKEIYEIASVLDVHGEHPIATARAVRDALELGAVF